MIQPPRRPQNGPLTTTLAGLTGLLLGAGIAAATATALWPGKPTPATLRPLETDPATAPARSGNIHFDAIGLRCAITTVIGTHGEHWAKGRLCRVQLSATSQDSVFGQIDNNLHQLTLDNGRKLVIDGEATQVKRQPLHTEVAAHGTAVYDLWFDLPRDRRPVTLHVRANDTEPPATIPLPEQHWSRRLRLASRFRSSLRLSRRTADPPSPSPSEPRATTQRRTPENTAARPAEQTPHPHRRHRVRYFCAFFSSAS